MAQGLAWTLFSASVLLFIAYEVRSIWIGRRYPERVARTAHARMRVNWVRALSREAGSEILAVQTLRNSLMSATIAASTAALALTGTIGLAAPRLVTDSGVLESFHESSLRAALEVLLILVLFASFVCSTMAMRYFNHAGFVMSMPVASPERQAMNDVAVDYVERAGLLYSWGLRFLLMIAPLIAGVVNPLAMLPMMMALVAVLSRLDRPAKPTSPSQKESTVSSFSTDTQASRPG